MEKGKLFNKVSIIDAAVILLLVLVIAVLGVRLGLFPTANEAAQETVELTSEEYEAVQCTVTIRFGEISSSLLSEPFAVGDRMFNGTRELGAITTVTKEASTAVLSLADGTAVTVDKPTAYNYYVEIPVELYRKDGALRLYNDSVIAVGQIVNFGTEYYCGKGTVVSVEKTQ